MDPLRLIIALGPLAVYLLAIGWLNLSRRSIVVTGIRDSLAMAIGLSGMVLVGPLELFMPMDAAALFGGYVWVLLVSFYILVATFILLMERPRLVIYNAPIERIRPLVDRLAMHLDPEAQWAGETLSLPTLGVELRLEATRAFRNVMLVANLERQSYAGWKHLEAHLRRELAAIETQPNWQGVGFIALALFIAVSVLYGAARDPAGIAQNLFEMLRM
jgi:hypothetical protein